MRLAIVNYDGEDAGWGDAMRAAGCDPVVVCQLAKKPVRVGSGARQRVGSGFSRSAIILRRRPTVAAVHGSAAAARPDVVHVNGLRHPARVRQLRRRLPARAALVVRDEGVDPAERPSSHHAAIRRVLADADLLLVDSHARSVAWRASGLAPDALTIGDVMPWTTTLAPLPRDEARRRSGLDGSPALLWIGSLTAEDDPLTVVRGFALVAGRFPTARLTMLCDSGALHGEVEQEIARAAVLGPRVRLQSAASPGELAAFYSAADYFVLGSRRADGDRLVLEAMACGAVPVVADVPAFRGFSGSERVGALWKPGQPQACADALTRAIARPLASEREAVRARFDKHYSWPAIGWRALDLYQQAMARRREALALPARPRRRAR